MTIKKWLLLSKGEKRVEIAKDVLKAIKDSVYLPLRGRYINVIKKSSEVSVQKSLKKKELQCKVCVIGSCFLSLIKFENKFNVDDISNSLFLIDYEDDENGSGRERLLKHFSKNQLGLIENAFEKTTCFTEHLEIKVHTANKSYSFKNNGEDDKIVLIRIMKNIILNKGTFKP